MTVKCDSVSEGFTLNNIMHSSKKYPRKISVYKTKYSQRKSAFGFSYCLLKKTEKGSTQIVWIAKHQSRKFPPHLESSVGKQQLSYSPGHKNEHVSLAAHRPPQRRSAWTRLGRREPPGTTPWAANALPDTSVGISASSTSARVTYTSCHMDRSHGVSFEYGDLSKQRTKHIMTRDKVSKRCHMIRVIAIVTDSIPHHQPQ